MMKIYKKEDVLNLFKELDVEYLIDYKIEYPELLSVDSKDSDYYRDNKVEFDILTKTYGESIKRREVAPVYISTTNSRGMGLYAREAIKRDRFIGIYIGTIKEQQEMVTYDETGFDTDYAWDYPDEIDGLPILEVDAKYRGNELRFGNHDKNPNLRVEHTIVENLWYIFFVADRDIDIDEELTVSYGEAYWDTEYRSES